jgi:hypothetical protein
MADIGTLNPEQMLQQQQILRQQKMAEMLMQQGAQQPQAQMVGGRYVAPSIFQNLAGLANQYVGQRGIEKAEQAQLELAKQLRQERAMTQEGVMNAINEGDTKKALAIASSRPEYAREFITPLLANVIPKAATPPAPTTEMQNFNFAKTPEGGGFKGSFTEFKNEVTPYQQQRLAFDREKFEFDKTQKVGGKDLTESQGKASAFQSQMVSASNAVNTLEGQGFNPTLFKSQTAVKLAGGAANPLIPVAAQQYKQAQDQWSEAYLRFKTGAAATEPEVVRNNRTFFPVFGDKPEQIAQKAAAREQAERDIGIAAGRGSNLGAQPIGPQPKQPVAQKPAGLPSQSAIEAELKRRGL